ncbi:hypothetical protein CVS40_7460, partial [Lucilia cuprina]
FNNFLFLLTDIFFCILGFSLIDNSHKTGSSDFNLSLKQMVDFFVGHNDSNTAALRCSNCCELLEIYIKMNYYLWF